MQQVLLLFLFCITFCVLCTLCVEKMASNVNCYNSAYATSRQELVYCGTEIQDSADFISI